MVAACIVAQVAEWDDSSVLVAEGPDSVPARHVAVVVQWARWSQDVE